jgi:hypothetical protein
MLNLILVPFPLQAPASALARIAIGKLTDIPHTRLTIMVQNKPNKMVSFRPNLSEALPHMMAVVHCDNEKTADVMPAHLATFFSSTPKLSIISGCHVMSANECEMRGSGVIPNTGIPKSRLPVRRTCILLIMVSRDFMLDKRMDCMSWECRVTR